MSHVIGSRYRIREKIGGGSFGTVHRGDDIKTGSQVAIKIEKSDCSVPQLVAESKTYGHLAGGVNVPRSHFFVREPSFQALVLDLAGPSVEDLMTKIAKSGEITKSEIAKSGGRLSLKTVLMLADQMLAAVEYIHRRGMIHRDIKPDNFVVGLASRANQLLVIDFGLAKFYRMPDGSHIPFRDHCPLTGTARYASISTLSGHEQSRRDDMESLAYIFFYLLRGSLPWQNVRAPSPQIKYDKILAIKKITPAAELCAGLPGEFAEYLDLVKDLQFNEEPEYSRYRKMFRDLFVRQKFVFDYKYDWSKDEQKSRVSTGRQQKTPLYATAAVAAAANNGAMNNGAAAMNKSRQKSPPKSPKFRANIKPSQSENAMKTIDGAANRKLTAPSTTTNKAIRGQPQQKQQADAKKKKNHKATNTPPGVPRFHPVKMSLKTPTKSAIRIRK